MILAEPPSGAPVSSGGAGSDRAADLLDAVSAAADLLDLNRAAVDRLNVYPVPDGDTGTNMTLTMRAAVDAGRDALGAGASRDELAAAMVHAALLGARGNSGNILAEWLRGLADERGGIDAPSLARALARGQARAYRAVVDPVEGTMLSVMRAAAEACQTAADAAGTIADALDAALAGAREALRRTPEQLETLRRAGVVDAGGQGIVCLLEGAALSARGETPAAGSILVAVPDGDGSALEAFVSAAHDEEAWGYCTNFVVHAEGLDVEDARRRLLALGGSAVVAGDAELLKVHIHTRNPGEVLSWAVGLGELDQIKIDNMEIQTRRRAGVGEAGDWTSPKTAPSVDAAAPVADETTAAAIGVVAVATGEGLANALRAMGAAAVVPGGQTMNPSVADLLAAVEALPHGAAVLLPNNPNILLSAARVPELASRPVAVVPSRSVPQGLAALGAFNPDDSLEGNLARMTEALALVRTIEVTRAVRDAEVDGVRVREGNTVALVDEKLVASGDDEAAVLRRALNHAEVGHAELVTVFAGDDAAEAEAEGVAGLIAELAPEATVELHRGGQAFYRFVVAVE